MHAIQPAIIPPLVGVIDTGVGTGTLIQKWPLRASPASVRIRPAAPERLVAAQAVMQKAFNDERPTDRALDQHYTNKGVARDCVEFVRMHCGIAAYQFVEPSAGDGSFFVVLPKGSIGIDVDPKYPGIITADFLSLEIESARPVFTIGNPPFGRNSELAIRFFNHAASFSEGIGLVVPRTFRKAWVLRRLDRHFHLICEVALPRDAFLFRGKPFDVPAVFQIWMRSAILRDLPHTESSHPDFDFTGREDADFALQRVGANAGQVHHNLKLKDSSHYFVRANATGVEATMLALQPEFAEIASNTAGNPSLAKTEIVALYRERTEGITPFWKIPLTGPGSSN